MFEHKIVQTSNVTASWDWNDQSKGVVQWTFDNQTGSQASVVLLRNGYYFGGAFWPVYAANSEFNTDFASKVEPLVDNGVDSNSPPLFVGEVNGKYGVYFLFTLSPGQKWSMLEGGFVNGVTPSGISVHEVTNLQVESMCVGYDSTQVSDWDSQTGTSLQGYSPNPKTMDTVVGEINGSYIQLYNDPISKGDCGSSGSSSGGSGTGSSCSSLLDKAITDFENDHMLKGIAYLFKYIECVSGSQPSKHNLMGFLKYLESKL